MDWTPDGTALVYSAVGPRGRMQLFAVDRQSGPPRQLSDDAHGLLHPQVSPDGAWIAATRIERTRQVYKRVLAE